MNCPICNSKNYKTIESFNLGKYYECDDCHESWQTENQHYDVIIKRLQSSLNEAESRATLHAETNIEIKAELKQAKKDIDDLLDLCNAGEFGWDRFHYVRYHNIRERNLYSEPVPALKYCRDYHKEIKELEDKLKALS